MKEMTISKEKRIENMIYEVRGQQVMLDSDLAILYGVETKRINESVKNNLNKFPERFSWTLSKEDSLNLRSKFSTANLITKSKTNPTVFTEQGIYMLATILKSKVATEVTINIMDAFVTMREYTNTSLFEQKYVNTQVMKNTERIEENFKKIELLQNKFSKLEEKRKSGEIFFEGQM